jgi:hypothetical protein
MKTVPEWNYSDSSMFPRFRTIAEKGADFSGSHVLASSFSGFGTSRTWRHVRFESAIGGKAVVTGAAHLRGSAISIRLLLNVGSAHAQQDNHRSFGNGLCNGEQLRRRQQDLHCKGYPRIAPDRWAGGEENKYAASPASVIGNVAGSDATNHCGH